ncbi:MAG: porin [Alsobacter sp.]
MEPAAHGRDVHQAVGGHMSLRLPFRSNLMRFHSLLLSSAALVASATVGQAADLPSKKAAPVDYVKVCTIGSFTGFVIPGSDVCLKIGGFARYQANWAEAQHGWYRSGRVGYGNAAAGGFDGAGNAVSTFSNTNGRTLAGFNQTATGSVKLDARTTTEYGLLRSFADIRVNSAGGAAIDKAYIQFGPWSFGKFQSFFDFYADGLNNVLALGSDTSTVGAAYSFNAGNGFFITAAIEENSVRNTINTPLIGAPTPATAFFSQQQLNQAIIAGGGAPNFAGINAANGFGAAGSIGGVTSEASRVPDAVLQLLYDPGANGWGKAQLSGALHEVRFGQAKPAVAGGQFNDSKTGYALQAGVTFNLPQLAAGDNLTLQAGYAEGALSYVGATNSGFGSVGSIVAVSDAIAVGPSGAIKLTKGFNALAAFQHFFAPNLSLSLFGGYTNIDYASGILTGQPNNAAGLRARDFRYYQIGTQVNWSPVKNLTIAGTVGYINVDAKRLGTDTVAVGGVNVIGAPKSADSWVTALRIQRDF